VVLNDRACLAALLNAAKVSAGRDEGVCWLLNDNGDPQDTFEDFTLREGPTGDLCDVQDGVFSVEATREGSSKPVYANYDQTTRRWL